MKLVKLAWAIVVTTLMAACAHSPTQESSAADLAAAKKALEEARAHRAAICANELVLAAELLYVEATVLHKQKKYDQVAHKVKEIERLVDQAKQASPPGCEEKFKKDEKPKNEKDEDDLDKEASGATDANASATIGGITNTVVYFDYNEATIREDSKPLLTRISQAMRNDSILRVEVEGHCDSRGSTEYNLHLGERRAYAVRKYLVDLGVESKQLEVISYGEERPVDLDDSEEAHQRNRRAELKKL
ncbi:MAG: OmpA family protein [Deltaproteobacteria bacterium]|nr:OmpA family protein [Deltaproteobacteria bacterium]